MYTVEFVRGPWAGKARTHAHDPRIWSCGTDARKAGMNGLYRTKSVNGRKVVMEWDDIPTKQPKRKKYVPI